VGVDAEQDLDPVRPTQGQAAHNKTDGGGDSLEPEPRPRVSRQADAIGRGDLIL
jgi:hypothetical protein